MAPHDDADASEASSGSFRRGLTTVLRWFLLVLPIAFLVARVDLRASVRIVSTIGVGPYLFALGTQLLSIGIATARWRTLMRAYGADPRTLPSFRSLFGSTLVGLYYGLLPSGLVGDVVRAERAKHALPAQLDSYVVLIVDRMSGVVGILALVAPTIARPEMRSLGESIYGALVVAALVTTGAVAFVLGIPSLAHRRPGVRRALARVPIVGGALATLTPIGSVRRLLFAIGTSILMQAVCAATIASLVLPVSGSGALGPVLVVAPAILFATFLPITPGALGQREVAFVTFLAAAGVSAERATAASLATTSLSFALGAIGGALVLAESLGRRRQ